MNIVNCAEIKNHLKLEGINIEEYSDEDIEYLIQNTLEYITGLLDYPLEPIAHKQITHLNHNQSIVLDHYPIETIQSVTLNKKEITPTEYTIDNEAGILYIYQINPIGEIIIEYTSCIHETILKYQIKPLIKDILTYNLDKSIYNNATSIKEGDVQVNFDNTTLLGNQINNRLESLKYTLNGARTRILL